MRHVYIQIFRFVAEHQGPVFETIEELLRDKSIKFSNLAGKRPIIYFIILFITGKEPVLERVRGELIKYWERQGRMNIRNAEEYARCEELFHLFV